MVEDCQNIFTIQLSKEASLIKVSPAPENRIVNNVETSELDLIGYEEIKNASISAGSQNSSCQIQGKDGNDTFRRSQKHIRIDANWVVQDDSNIFITGVGESTHSSHFLERLCNVTISGAHGRLNFYKEKTKELGVSFLVVDFEKQGDWTSSLYGIVILIVAVVLTFPTTILPHPDYLNKLATWPNSLTLPVIIKTINYSTLVLLAHHFDYMLIMNTGYAFSITKLWYSMKTVTLITVMICTMLHAVWFLLGYAFPIPFLANVVLLVVFIAVNSVLWFQFALPVWSNPILKKQFKWYIFIHIILLGWSQGYLLLAGVFETIPDRFQPILALIFPILRHVMGKIYIHSTNKAKGQNESSAVVAVFYMTSVNHALFLSIVISSFATSITACLIAAIDTGLSVKSCFEIMILHRTYGPHARATKKKKVQGLVMKETFELLLPIIYSLAFTITYYGPNAEIMGNIKGEFWHYNNKVDDIMIPLSKIGLFIILDLLRVIFITFALWKWCNISLFSKFCQLMETYWKALSIYIALSMVGVS